MSDVKSFSMVTGGTVAVIWALVAPNGPLIVVLLAVNVLDYLTGIILAASNGELSSKKGLLGILKKMGYWSLVLTALAVELIMEYASPQLGLAINIFPALTAMVILWLSLNETFSIVENLGELGVPLPKFFSQIIEKLRDNIDKR